MKKVYISGPMTGLPYLNRPRFESAANKVAEFGFTPVNPHNLCDPSWDWQKCMRADIAALCDCDAIFLLADALRIALEKSEEWDIDRSIDSGRCYPYVSIRTEQIRDALEAIENGEQLEIV